ncbi:hypothetical protein ACFQ4O_17780, partial [Methylopila musalis]
MTSFASETFDTGVRVMGKAVKTGFAIGFAVAVVLASAYGCQPEFRRTIDRLTGAPTPPPTPAPPAPAPRQPDAPSA